MVAGEKALELVSRRYEGTIMVKLDIHGSKVVCQLDIVVKKCVHV